MKKNLYKDERGVIRSYDDLKIEFVPGLCCAHEWQPTAFGGHCQCSKCRASCNRGADGKIEHYSNTSVDFAVPKLGGA